MSEQPTETPELSPRHLKVTLMNGMSSPVLRMEPGVVEWWWNTDFNCLQIGPTENCPDPEDYAVVYIPREHVMMVEESVCTCVHDLANEAQDWLAGIFDSRPPEDQP